MSLLRVLIVDDEALARDRLRGMLEAEAGVEVVGECANGTEALTAIRFASPDAVFLDIQMPGPDGLQVAALLPATGRPAIVFTTAHAQFALGAFDAAAVDYLLKPFDRDRLGQALARVRALGRGRTPEAGAAGEAPARSDRLAFRTDGRIVFLRAEEIRWAEADDNYVTLHLASGRLLLRETLSMIEARLGVDAFIRINRSAVVNVDQIKELQPALHGDYTVLLRDGTRLPLSRSLRGKLDRFVVGQ